ncbi:MAG: 2-hydroxyacyl-CoA dehydratase, partial [Candidatus Helarchaeota archaeon]
MMTEVENNIKMWNELGLDLEKHDELLNGLGAIFEEIFIKSQKNRPDMSFFDFVVDDIHGIRIKELIEAKSNVKKVIGTYCIYVPDEIIIALDAIGIGLCGGTNFSNYVLIGETTCDGKKKAWEILSNYTDIYVMEVPQCKQREQARELFYRELKALTRKLEEVTGNKLTIEGLKAAMEKIETKRKMLRRIYDTRKNNPPLISGKDALLVSQIAFYDDPDRQIQMLGKLADKLEDRVKKGVGVVDSGTPRIMIAGTPMAIPNWKLHHIIETSGAIVVVEETCTGTRY